MDNVLSQWDHLPPDVASTGRAHALPLPVGGKPLPTWGIPPSHSPTLFWVGVCEYPPSLPFWEGEVHLSLLERSRCTPVEFYRRSIILTSL